MVEHKHHEEHREHKPASHVKIQMNHVIIGLLVILLIFSGVQAVQIDSLQDDIESGNVGSSSGSKTQASAPRQVAPAMVGGC